MNKIFQVCIAALFCCLSVGMADDTLIPDFPYNRPRQRTCLKGRLRFQPPPAVVSSIQPDFPRMAVW